MMHRTRHLTDDRLVEVCLAAVPARVDQHLQSCAECRARRDDILYLLGDVSQAAAIEADAAFSADRLTRQQARILQRIEQEGRPARVIAFPAGSGAEPIVLRSRPAMRWIAGAAAAGLIIGVLAGHLAHDLSMVRPARARQVTASMRPAINEPTLRAVATTISEDEFLGQVELAIESSGSGSLRPLDELTPRVWEVTSP